MGQNFTYVDSTEIGNLDPQNLKAKEESGLEIANFVALNCEKVAVICFFGWVEKTGGGWCRWVSHRCGRWSPLTTALRLVLRWSLFDSTMGAAKRTPAGGRLHAGVRALVVPRQRERVNGEGSEC